MRLIKKMPSPIVVESKSLLVTTVLELEELGSINFIDTSAINSLSLYTNQLYTYSTPADMTLSEMNMIYQQARILEDIRYTSAKITPGVIEEISGFEKILLQKDAYFDSQLRRREENFSFAPGYEHLQKELKEYFSQAIFSFSTHLKSLKKRHVYDTPKKPVDDLFRRIQTYADDTEVFQKHPDDMRIQNTSNKDLLLYAHALYTSVFTRKQTNILTGDSDFLRLNKKFSSETTDSVLRESLQKHPVNIYFFHDDRVSAVHSSAMPDVSMFFIEDETYH